MEEYTTTVPEKKHTKNVYIKPVAITLGAVIIITLSFLGGMQFQKHHGKAATARGTSATQNGKIAGGRRMRRAGGFGGSSGSNSSGQSSGNSGSVSVN